MSGMLLFPALLRSDFRKRLVHITVDFSPRPTNIQSWSSAKKETNYCDTLTTRNQAQEFKEQLRDLPAFLLSSH